MANPGLLGQLQPMQMGHPVQSELVQMDQSSRPRQVDVGFKPEDQANITFQRSKSASDDVVPEELLKHLPSKQLETRIEIITGKSLWKNQTKRKRPGYATIRFRPGEMVNTDEIARELVQADEIDGANSHSEEIRGLPTTLGTKKEISDKVKQQKIQQSNNEKRPGWFTRTRYKLAMGRKHFKERAAGMRYIFLLWQSHLNVIESHFGSGVASYFLFIRGLFLLNIPVFLLTFAFVIVPQILFRWLQQEPPGYHQNVSFTGEELLTGMGWFEETELYYGYYTSDVINVGGAPYDMKYAYLCSCIGYYLLVLIILSRMSVILCCFGKYVFELFYLISYLPTSAVKIHRNLLNTLRWESSRHSVYVDCPPGYLPDYSFLGAPSVGAFCIGYWRYESC